MRVIFAALIIAFLSAQALALSVSYPVSTATLNVSAWGQTFVQHTSDAQALTDLGIPNHNLITVSAGSAVSVSGSMSLTGTVTANAFSGTLPASNLSGTIASARISGAYTGITGVGTLTNLNVTGSVTVTGSITETNAAWGEMYVSYNATAMPIALTDTYYTVTTNVVTGDLQNFTFTNSGSDCYLTVGVGGMYRFVGTLSFSGGNGDEFHGGLSINNARPLGCCEFSRKMGAGGDVGSAAFSGTHRFTAGQTLRVKIENVTDADGPTINVMNFSTNRIAP